MASTPIEFIAPDGVGPLTFKMFALGSDTELVSVSATHQTNRKQTYIATVNDTLTNAVHHAVAVDGSGFPYVSGYVKYVDDTNMLRVESSYALAVMSRDV